MEKLVKKNGKLFYKTRVLIKSTQIHTDKSKYTRKVKHKKNLTLIGGMYEEQ